MSITAHKPKILYLITKANWGGAQKSVYTLARHFQNLEKFEVIVAHGESSLSGDGNLFENKLKALGVRTVQLPSLTRDVGFEADIRSFIDLVRLFRTERPAIVHLNSSKAGALGAPAARLAGVPRIVFTMRGAPFLEDRPAWQNWAIKYTTWLTAVFSDVFVTVSHFEERIVRMWPLLKSKITCIYNGIESPDFISREQARAYLSAQIEKKISENVQIIGSIAELTDNKGLLEFLPILARRAKQQDFIYVHFGDGELAEKLKTYTSELGLGDRVFWLGFVPDASKYLKAFDLFTLPSKKEGFPNVLLEAKLAGVSIEASTAGGIPELLQLSEQYIRKNLTPNEIGKLYEKVYNAQ